MQKGSNFNYALSGISLLITAALYSPLVQAEVDVYGSIRAGWVNKSTNSENFHDTFDDQVSRFGIAGSNNINKDLVLTYGVEQGIDITDAELDDLPRNLYIGLESAHWGNFAIGRLDSGATGGSPFYSQVLNITNFAPYDAGIAAVGTSIFNARNRTSNSIGYSSNKNDGWVYRARYYNNGNGIFNFTGGDTRSLDLGAEYENEHLKFAVGYGKDWSDEAKALDYKWQTGLRYTESKLIQPYVLLGQDHYNQDTLNYLLTGTKLSKGKHALILNYAQRDILNKPDAVYRKHMVGYIYNITKKLSVNLAYDYDVKDYANNQDVTKGYGIGMRYDFKLFE
ncbi:porin [Acinetobacter schindleri]|uniref:porin n=1 Tax=Acinetobacter schindleri TaxID=108981 RepID=UPI003D04D911